MQASSYCTVLVKYLVYRTVSITLAGIRVKAKWVCELTTEQCSCVWLCVVLGIASTH
jgi:hypothetical protein